VRLAQHHSDTLFLLGARAEHAEVDYSWIQPGGIFDSPLTNTLLRVNRLWENPPAPVAQMLLARGGLWNTFVTIGRAALFLSLLANTLSPWAWRAFLAAQNEPTPGAAQDKLWPLLAPGNFSHQVLSPNTGSLAVLRVGDIGWSDLGTPERVRNALARWGLNLHQEQEHENSEELVSASSR
jgi:mannose-1-phosphate guanylyltransferase